MRPYVFTPDVLPSVVDNTKLACNRRPDHGFVYDVVGVDKRLGFKEVNRLTFV